MDNVKGAVQVVYVDSTETTVCCRGASQSLGHPAVYLSFDNGVSVQCYYCGCEFRRTQEHADNLSNTS